IEQQPEQRALVVIRNLRVYRVLILPVILDPRIEARLFSTLHEPPRRVLQVSHRARLRTQILALADQSGATQSEICIVISDALGDPQNFRIVFLRVIKRAERVGTNSLHVPEMKKLVRDETEKAAIVAFRGIGGIRRGRRGAIAAANLKTEARVTERRRIQVFESAAGVLSQMQNKRVVAIWNLAAHYLDFRLDDLLHVASHALRIVVPCSVDHDAMRNTFDVEDERLEVAGFERRVVKNVEILGAKSVLLSYECRQSSRDFPNVRREHAHGGRRLQKTLEIHEQVGVVPEGVFRV